MKYLLAFIIILGFLSSAHAARIHVTPTAKARNSGKKWSKATTLKQALATASAGDEIWVAAGTYFTSNATDRRATFIVPAGVSLIGGFVGREKNLRQRPVDGRSTLSGELGQPHDHSDNAYTVLLLEAKGRLFSLVQGFNVVGGNSKTYADGINRRSAGGGIILQSNASNTTAHHIKDCTFEDNRAHHGGAALISGGRPVFASCTFVTNTADFHGGAVYNDGEDRVSSPVFEQCSFIDNASNSGAGLTNNAINGETHPMLIGCKFIDNVSLINGAAIFNIRKETGKAKPIIEDCEFIGNESILGDDIYDLGEGAYINAAEEKSGKMGGTLKPVAAKRR